jgi:hypothetical protein
MITAFTSSHPCHPRCTAPPYHAGCRRSPRARPAVLGFLYSPEMKSLRSYAAGSWGSINEERGGRGGFVDRRADGIGVANQPDGSAVA